MNKAPSWVIHVLPPWWETWWFRVLAFLALASAIVIMFLIRTRVITRRNQILKETVNQKTKELQEINLALLKREEEIEAKNTMLSAQGKELAAQNEELIQTQEEISAQRDLVANQNQNLEHEVEKHTRELAEYNHQLEQFAFISAHNLRAPVAGIMGLGNLLSIPGSTPGQKEEIYPKLVNTTHELDAVVKDLNAILELKK